jgi:hypothetical protein
LARRKTGTFPDIAAFVLRFSVAGQSRTPGIPANSFSDRELSSFLASIFLKPIATISHLVDTFQNTQITFRKRIQARSIYR